MRVLRLADATAKESGEIGPLPLGKYGEAHHRVQRRTFQQLGSCLGFSRDQLLQQSRTGEGLHRWTVTRSQGRDLP